VKEKKETSSPDAALGIFCPRRRIEKRIPPSQQGKCLETTHSCQPRKGIAPIPKYRGIRRVGQNCRFSTSSLSADSPPSHARFNHNPSIVILHDAPTTTDVNISFDLKGHANTMSLIPCPTPPKSSISIHSLDADCHSPPTLADQL
jgi:hypothetical protein